MRGSSVLFGGESLWKRSQQQPHLLPVDFLANPCALEPIHQVNLPPYSTLNVLDNWNDYQIAHLRGLQEPQGSEPGGGETRSPTAALTPRRAKEAHSEESTVAREAHPAPEPRHLSTDAQTQARSFPDRGQARPPPRSPVQRVHSGLNVLTAETHGLV